VHISTMSVHGDPQPDGLEEDNPLAPGAAHPYVATKAAAEVALNTVRSRGLTTVSCVPAQSVRWWLPVGRRTRRQAAPVRLARRISPRRCDPLGPHQRPRRDDVARGDPPSGRERDLPCRRPMRTYPRLLRADHDGAGADIHRARPDPVVSRCRIGTGEAGSPQHPALIDSRDRSAHCRPLLRLDGWPAGAARTGLPSRRRPASSPGNEA
jgi:hypothetical protein